MQVRYFRSGRVAEVAAPSNLEETDEGFYWFDVERSEQRWSDVVEPWSSIRLHENHVADTLNGVHMPYFEAVDDYELLILRALDVDSPAEGPVTRSVVFIITPRVLVTVRPQGDQVFHPIHQQLLSSVRHVPGSIAALLYLAIDRITDTLLERRDKTTELVAGWQDRLLNPDDKFDDWRALMRLRNQLRRLEVISESQMDALGEWRDQTQLTIDGHLGVRFNDNHEHLRRFFNHTLVIQHDIDALTQIYFSANAQRTNDILRFLTVLSAVFLPLNLVAGIFGTNFTHLPFLQTWFGPWLMFLAMSLLVAALVGWFRRRHWV